MTLMRISEINHMNYGIWKTIILKISRYRIAVKAETVQALIQRGSQLKREEKISSYDEWTHLMWVLKNKYREMTSEICHKD